MLIKFILSASILYGINPIDLINVGLVESNLNINVKPQKNTNGTYDYGPFQINTIHINGQCSEYKINTLRGNTYCAAKLIKSHKHKQKTDSMWLARYHSKTPKYKKRYHKKLKKYRKKAKVFYNNAVK